MVLLYFLLDLVDLLAFQEGVWERLASRRTCRWNKQVGFFFFLHRYPSFHSYVFQLLSRYYIIGFRAIFVLLNLIRAHSLSLWRAKILCKNILFIWRSLGTDYVRNKLLCVLSSRCLSSGALSSTILPIFKSLYFHTLNWALGHPIMVIWLRDESLVLNNEVHFTFFLRPSIGFSLCRIRPSHG